MLLINQEFRRGVLFVRLKGSLTSKEVPYLNEEVTKLLKKLKMHNVVFNISGLKEIDLDGVNALLNNYKMCRRLNGISMLCGGNTKIREYINNSKVSSMYQIKDELAALNIIRI